MDSRITLIGRKALAGILFGVLLCAPAKPLKAQKVGTTSMQFLKITPDARISAMAGAASIGTRTANAVHGNPAGLADIAGLDVRLSYVDWFVDVEVSSAALAYSFRWGTVALQVTQMSMGDIEETTAEDLGFQGSEYNPGLSGSTFAPSSGALGLSYSRSLTDQFNFGVSAKVVREDLGRADASAVLFDGGLLYQTGYRSLVVSAGVRHFGGDVTFVNEAYPPPQTFYLGLASYLFAPDAALLGTISRQTLRIAGEITHPRDAGQQYNLGAEYSFNEMLFLRGGYRLQYDVQGLTFGGGISIRGVQLDYAFNDFGERLRPVHRFTLGVAL